MSQGGYLTSVFPEPPLLAFRTQKNISDFLIRARLPPKPKTYPRRRFNGMKRCGKPCVICPYVKEVKSVKGPTFT
jgi:hypothetical protein